jgi:hypothetical protein
MTAGPDSAPSTRSAQPETSFREGRGQCSILSANRQSERSGDLLAGLLRQETLLPSMEAGRGARNGTSCNGRVSLPAAMERRTGLHGPPKEPSCRNSRWDPLGISADGRGMEETCSGMGAGTLAGVEERIGRVVPVQGRPVHHRPKGDRVLITRPGPVNDVNEVAFRSANAICSSVYCFLPIENPPFLVMSKVKTLTSRMDQETGRTSQGNPDDRNWFHQWGQITTAVEPGPETKINKSISNRPADQQNSTRPGVIRTHDQGIMSPLL